MKPGDRVWYTQTCRGGYGFERDVPAVFERAAGRRRVQIRVLLKTGGTRRIFVHPKNVRPRKDAGVDPNLGTIERQTGGRPCLSQSSTTCRSKRTNCRLT